MKSIPLLALVVLTLNNLDITAHHNESPLDGINASKLEIFNPSAPKPIGTFSEAIKVGNTVYLSGQIGFDAGANKLVNDSFEAQAEQVFGNLRAVAEASGGTVDNIVKLTVFITDFKNLPTINKVMERVFKQPFPARSSIGVASLAFGADIEVEGILQLTET